MTTEAQKKATMRYEAKNTIQVHLKLNKNSDADIIKKLEEVESKQGYIKGLIRNDLGT